MAGISSLFGLASDWRRALSLHHLANTLLALAFYVIKTSGLLCTSVFGLAEEECHINASEHQLLIFLAFVIFWKNRKATSWFHYLSNVFLFAKLANLVLFFRVEPRVGIVYGILALLVTVLLPEPAYTGPENILYFRGPGLAEELKRSPSTAWLIEFYTAWSPECQQVTAVFAQLSERFSLPNLKFGKLDVGKFGEEAERFRVNAHPTSRQLPTFALFRDGKEQRRRPLVNANGRAIPFTFTADNVIHDFDLQNLHNECSQALSKNQRKQMDSEKKEK